jgi:hypothetical protein
MKIPSALRRLTLVITVIPVFAFCFTLIPLTLGIIWLGRWILGHNLDNLPEYLDYEYAFEYYFYRYLDYLTTP